MPRCLIGCADTPRLMVVPVHLRGPVAARSNAGLCLAACHCYEHEDSVWDRTRRMSGGASDPGHPGLTSIDLRAAAGRLGRCLDLFFRQPEPHHRLPALPDLVLRDFNHVAAAE